MKANATDITLVLDRSGSMDPIADDTIGGVNAFVAEQKKLPGEASYTLVQFDHEYFQVFGGIPLGDVPPLTRETFVPRGTTALLDAIGRAIVETGLRLSAKPEPERPSIVIFVIMTDGQENASQEYTADRINGMITHQREVYSWQFIFLGANQDALQTGGALGVHNGTALSCAANGAGTRAAY
ncbi:vWA domain-containing protein, partial [Singulisphaera rosea]